MDEKERIIQIYAESIKHNDEINKRLVTALIATVISFCIAVTVICSFVPYVYFTAEYYYPTIETNDSENTTTTIGGE